MMRDSIGGTMRERVQTVIHYSREKDRAAIATYAAVSPRVAATAAWTFEMMRMGLCREPGDNSAPWRGQWTTNK